MKSHGFSINPYDICIANSTIEKNKCAIAWYVDDNNVFSIDEEMNTKIIDTKAENFGELTVTREKHKFLVMDI